MRTPLGAFYIGNIAEAPQALDYKNAETGASFRRHKYRRRANAMKYGSWFHRL